MNQSLLARCYHVNWMAKNKLGTFRHDFTKRWVSMDSQCDILKRCTHFDCETKLGNQVGSFDTCDVSTQNKTCFFVSNDFHEAVRAVQRTMRVRYPQTGTSRISLCSLALSLALPSDLRWSILDL